MLGTYSGWVETFKTRPPGSRSTCYFLFTHGCAKNVLYTHILRIITIKHTHDNQILHNVHTHTYIYTRICSCKSTCYPGIKMHTHTHTHIYIYVYHTYTCIHMCIIYSYDVHTIAYTHMYIHTYVHTHIYALASVYTYVCTHACINVYRYVRVYMYIYIYIYLYMLI